MLLVQGPDTKDQGPGAAVLSLGSTWQPPGELLTAPSFPTPKPTASASLGWHRGTCAFQSPPGIPTLQTSLRPSGLWYSASHEHLFYVGWTSYLFQKALSPFCPWGNAEMEEACFSFTGGLLIHCVYSLVSLSPCPHTPLLFFYPHLPFILFIPHRLICFSLFTSSLIHVPPFSTYLLTCLPIFIFAHLFSWLAL